MHCCSGARCVPSQEGLTSCLNIPMMPHICVGVPPVILKITIQESRPYHSLHCHTPHAPPKPMPAALPRGSNKGHNRAEVN